MIVKSIMANDITSCNLRAKRSSRSINFFAKCKHLSLWQELPSSPPEMQVVTCFLCKNSKILVLQRGKKDAQYGLWGIPGGKLEASESCVAGLRREIQEETGAVLSESCFSFLDSAISKTSTDGKYGLHLYYANFPENLSPSIDLTEHLSYQWVTINQFIELDLLHAQKEAFLFIRSKLLKHIKERANSVSRQSN